MLLDMDIIRFKGGLGNQMFQYAFLKSLSSRGRNVAGSLGFYDKNPHLMPFCLTDIFGNISFNVADEETFEKVDKKWREIKRDEEKLNSFLKDYPNRFFWVESPMFGTYNKHVFDTCNCIFVGYWQTERYFKQIRNKILYDFQFSEGERALIYLRDKLLSSDNCVSLHVRRGDYLKTPELYGDICTVQYYKSAIQIMMEEIENPQFIIFSDDVEWVKEQSWLGDALYIESNLFRNYRPWYDMCLMTCCAGNIIANSSFSWWGAWLNQRTGRKVIAPRRWINKREMPDICPKDWIRL